MSGSMPRPERALERALERISRLATDAPRERQDLDNRTVVVEEFCHLLPDGVGPLFGHGDNLLKRDTLGLYVSCGDVDDCVPSGGCGPRPATLVIASISGSPESQACADLVCLNDADDVPIQALLEAVMPSGGGKVLLLDGRYSFDSFIHAEHVTWEGMGSGTLIDVPVTGGPAIVPEGADSRVTGLSFFSSRPNPDAETVLAIGVGDAFTADPGGTVDHCFFDGCSVELTANGSQVNDCTFTGEFGTSYQPDIVNLWAPYDTRMSGCFYVDCTEIGVTGEPVLNAASVYGPLSDCSVQGGEFDFVFNAAGPMTNIDVGQNGTPVVWRSALYGSNCVVSNSQVKAIMRLGKDDNSAGVYGYHGVSNVEVIIDSDSATGAVGILASNGPVTGCLVDVGAETGVGIMIDSTMVPVTGNSVLISYDDAIGVWLTAGADSDIVTANIISLGGGAGADVQDDGTANSVHDNVTVP